MSLWENVSLDPSMACEHYANEVRSRLTFKFLSILIKIRCFKGLKLKDITSKKARSPKMRTFEQCKFSLDVDFVWILQKRKSLKYGNG